MRIENQITDTIKIGQIASKQATISEHKISKLQYILTKGLYSDPITACITEITNNGIDSVIQAGKDSKKHPVIVEIDKNEQGNYFFRVTDRGLGLNQNEFENILMNYLESTKENDDESIGFFGLGSKSFLSLDRAATFTCRKDGKELKYLAYSGAEFCEYDLLYEKDTTEENGVIFEIPISDYSEKRYFESKALQKLAYYDTVVLIIDKEIIKNQIVRSKDWQYSNENNDSFVHLCLKDVYYHIDWNKLGVTGIRMPIALRFNLKDGIAVTPSRESIIYTEKVKQIIKDKISLVADWFVKKYNDNAPDEADSIIKEWDNLDKTEKTVNVDDDINFTINSISGYSKIPIKLLKIKGISIKTPEYYKSRSDNLLSNYKAIVNKKGYSNFKSDRKSVKYIVIKDKILRKDSVILVNNNPLGYVRKYLQNKYDGQNTTLIVKSKNRELRFNLESVNNSYCDMLLLPAFSKKEWRARIQEFLRVEKEFFDQVVDERDVENTQEFKDWLSKHKEDIKSGRIPSNSYNYNTLNKQNGEMTISIARSAKTGNGTECVFEKKTFKINELYKQSKLFVLFSNKEEAEKYWTALLASNISVCMIGNKEINKLPLFRNKKFIKFEEFMTRDCKPFMRIASSILFKKTTNDFTAIKAGKDDIFNTCLYKYLDDYNQLRAYITGNTRIMVDEQVANAIVDIATEKNLFDKSLWDVYLRLKDAVEKLDFLTVMKSPAVWDTQAQIKINRIINQMLLFQKKYYDLEGYELVKKSDVATKVAEEDKEYAEIEELEEAF